MHVGILPDPVNHPAWAAISAYLEPAAERGGVPILEEHEEVWIAHTDRIWGAATARKTTAGYGEVVLVGGEKYRTWIGEMDRAIGAWLKDEGKSAVRAYGRKGWTRVLGKMGWNVIGYNGQNVGYERVL